MLDTNLMYCRCKIPYFLICMDYKIESEATNMVIFVVSMKFEEYRLSQEVKRNLEEMGFKRPTDIQFKCLPHIQRGEDLLAIAQTQHLRFLL